MKKRTDINNYPPLYKNNTLPVKATAFLVKQVATPARPKKPISV
jgi:hypothetical protein